MIPSPSHLYPFLFQLFHYLKHKEPSRGTQGGEEGSPRFPSLCCFQIWKQENSLRKRAQSQRTVSTEDFSGKPLHVG